MKAGGSLVTTLKTAAKLKGCCSTLVIKFYVVTIIYFSLICENQWTYHD